MSRKQSGGVVYLLGKANRQIKVYSEEERDTWVNKGYKVLNAKKANPSSQRSRTGGKNVKPPVPPVTDVDDDDDDDDEAGDDDSKGDGADES